MSNMSLAFVYQAGVESTGMGSVLTCSYICCLLYHEFQCLVMSYQTSHLDNYGSAMGRYGKRSGIQKLENEH